MTETLPHVSKFPTGDIYRNMFGDNITYQVFEHDGNTEEHRVSHQSWGREQRAQYFPETGELRVDGYYANLDTFIFKELFEELDIDDYQALMTWALGYFREAPSASNWTEVKSLDKFCKKLWTRLSTKSGRFRDLPLAYITWKNALEANLLVYRRSDVDEWIEKSTYYCDNEEAVLLGNIKQVWRTYCDTYENTHEVVLEGLDMLETATAPISIVVPTLQTDLMKQVEEGDDDAE